MSKKKNIDVKIYRFNKAEPLFKTAVKKRLDKLLLDSQLVLIWATFKSKCHTTTSGIRKIIADAVFKAVPRAMTPETAKQLFFKPRLAASKGLYTPTPTFGVTVSKFPKTALNEYCSNVNFSLVGCGVDLLVLHKTDPLTLLRPDCNTVRSSEITPWPQNKLGNLIKTQQAALFLKQALIASEAHTNKEDRWDQNQLLGAFVSSTGGCSKGGVRTDVIFISSSEVRQSFLLQQAFETTPDQTVVRPFKEAVNKLKFAYTGQSRSLNMLLTQLVFMLDRPKRRLILNSCSLAR